VLALTLVVAGSAHCALDWSAAWLDGRRDLPGVDLGEHDGARLDRARPGDLRGDSILAPSWIVIPAGTFVMGSPPSEACRGHDPLLPSEQRVETRHVVRLTHSFEIMASEVTIEVFKKLLGYLPSGDAGCPRCPADHMSWHDAVALCNALSAQRGWQRCYANKGSQGSCFVDKQCDDGQLCVSGVCSVYEEAASFAENIYRCPGYRLPTEAEWEYAYRAGSTTAYYDGTTGGECNYCSASNPVNNLGWYVCNAGEAHPVMKKPPNTWGLYDMAGNVWEWCHEWYAEDLGPAPQVDPLLAKVQTRVERLLRGGGSYSQAGLLRAAQRNSAGPGDRWADVGVRCVRTRLDLAPDGGPGAVDAGR
jgi:sulfatase modifying factor 1